MAAGCATCTRLGFGFRVKGCLFQVKCLVWQRSTETVLNTCYLPKLLFGFFESLQEPPVADALVSIPAGQSILLAGAPSKT